MDMVKFRADIKASLMMLSFIDQSRIDELTDVVVARLLKNRRLLTESEFMELLNPYRK